MIINLNNRKYFPKSLTVNGDFNVTNKLKLDKNSYDALWSGKLKVTITNRAKNKQLQNNLFYLSCEQGYVNIDVATSANELVIQETEKIRISIEIWKKSSISIGLNSLIKDTILRCDNSSVEIGDNVTINKNVVIHACYPNAIQEKFKGQKNNIIIADNVFIDETCHVLNNTQIGSDSFVMTNSTLWKEYSSNSIIAGNLAKEVAI